MSICRPKNWSVTEGVTSETGSRIPNRTRITHIKKGRSPAGIIGRHDNKSKGNEDDSIV